MSSLHLRPVCLNRHWFERPMCVSVSAWSRRGARPSLCRALWGGVGISVVRVNFTLDCVLRRRVSGCARYVRLGETTRGCDTGCNSAGGGGSRLQRSAPMMSLPCCSVGDAGACAAYAQSTKAKATRGGRGARLRHLVHSWGIGMELASPRLGLGCGHRCCDD